MAGKVSHTTIKCSPHDCLACLKDIDVTEVLPSAQGDGWQNQSALSQWHNPMSSYHFSLGMSSQHLPLAILVRHLAPWVVADQSTDAGISCSARNRSNRSKKEAGVGWKAQKPRTWLSVISFTHSSCLGRSTAADRSPFSSATSVALGAGRRQLDQ